MTTAEKSALIEELQTERDGLKQQVFLAESVIHEYRIALSDAQFSLAKSNAQLKLARALNAPDAT